MRKPPLEIGTAAGSLTMNEAENISRRFSSTKLSTTNISELHAPKIAAFEGDALEFAGLIFELANGTYEVTEAEEAYPLTAFMLAVVAQQAVEQNRKILRNGTITKLRKAAENLMIAAFGEGFYLGGCADVLVMLTKRKDITSDVFDALIRSAAKREDELVQRVALGSWTILNEVLRQRERKGHKGRPLRNLAASNLARMLDTEIIEMARRGVLPSGKRNKDQVVAELPRVVREFLRMGKISPLRTLGQTEQENVDRHVKRLRAKLLGKT